MAGRASAQEQAAVEIEDLAGFIQSIPQIPPPDQDPYTALFMRSDLASEAAIVAWLSEDEAALTAVLPVLRDLGRAALRDDDQYTHGYMAAVTCIATAALGDAQAAERSARVIDLEEYRAYALGLIAADHARRGNRDEYERLLAASFEELDALLQDDQGLAPVERSYGSWVAWPIVNHAIRHAVFSGLYEADDALQHLRSMADTIGNMPLDPGASAECYGLFAASFAVLGDEQSGRRNLQSCNAAIQAEANRITAEDFDPDIIYYGTDAGMMDQLAALVQLGEIDTTLERLGDATPPYFSALGHAIVAAHLTALGEDEIAVPLMDDAERYILQADRVVDMMARGKEDPLVRTSDHWAFYTPDQLVWELTTIAADIARAGDNERLERLLATVHTDIARHAIRLGAARGRLEPTPTGDRE